MKMSLRVFWIIVLFQLACGLVHAGESTKINLDDVSFISSWTKSGKAKLINGEYREPAASGSATEIVVKLTHHTAFGKLDGKEVAAATYFFKMDVLYVNLEYGTGTMKFIRLRRRPRLRAETVACTGAFGEDMHFGVQARALPVGLHDLKIALDPLNGVSMMEGRAVS